MLEAGLRCPYARPMSLTIDLLTLLLPDPEQAAASMQAHGLPAGAVQALPRELALSLGRAELDQARTIVVGAPGAVRLRLIAGQALPAGTGWIAAGLTLRAPDSGDRAALPGCLQAMEGDEPPAGQLRWLRLATEQMQRSLGFYAGLGAMPVAGDGQGGELSFGSMQRLQLVEAAVVAPAAECSLLAVRLCRRLPAAESTLMQPCRVLSGPQGEVIELL